jgi:hypothetical protein
MTIQHNSIFLGRSASGPIGPPLFHFYLMTILNLVWKLKSVNSTLRYRKVPKKIKKFNVIKMSLFLIICENFNSIWFISSYFDETCSFWVICNILKHLRNFDFPRVVAIPVYEKHSNKKRFWAQEESISRSRLLYFRFLTWIFPPRGDLTPLWNWIL